MHACVLAHPLQNIGVRHNPVFNISATLAMINDGWVTHLAGSKFLTSRVAILVARDRAT